MFVRVIKGGQNKKEKLKDARTSLNHIVQSARGGDDKIAASFQFAELLLDVLAPIDHDGAEDSSVSKLWCRCIGEVRRG